MKKLIGLTLLLGSNAVAGDTWLCTEESSQRRGNTIVACGVAVDHDESMARLKAFDASKTEFDRVCNSSDDCAYKTVTIEPKRTACELTAGGYKCYRLVSYEIHEETFKDTAPVKLKRGMPREDLMKTLGSPLSVVDLPNYEDDVVQQQIFYKGPMCVYGSLNCYVITENNKVIKFNDFKPSYMRF